jgi:hypothetical protein
LPAQAECLCISLEEARGILLKNLIGMGGFLTNTAFRGGYCNKKIEAGKQPAVHSNKILRVNAFLGISVSSNVAESHG